MKNFYGSGAYIQRGGKEKKKIMFKKTSWTYFLEFEMIFNHHTSKKLKKE